MHFHHNQISNFDSLPRHVPRLSIPQAKLNSRNKFTRTITIPQWHRPSSSTLTVYELVSPLLSVSAIFLLNSLRDTINLKSKFSNHLLVNLIVLREGKELVLNSIVVARNKQERIKIETSINSVRVSIGIKQSDEVEEILCRRFMRFLMVRAENFAILRRKATEGFDISFLITNAHCEDFVFSFSSFL